jgi:hypothetical protein
MTEQEIFTTVATHLLTQRAKSLRDNGCAYRGENGTKCAIGCLIPDDIYTLKIEGASIHGLLQGTHKKILPANFRSLFVNHENFLTQLQRLHDTEFVECWEKELKIIAQNRNLIFPSL